jgi:hypothetical protein
MQRSSRNSLNYRDKSKHAQKVRGEMGRHLKAPTGLAGDSTNSTMAIEEFLRLAVHYATERLFDMLPGVKDL